MRTFTRAGTTAVLAALFLTFPGVALADGHPGGPPPGGSERARTQGFHGGPTGFVRFDGADRARLIAALRAARERGVVVARVPRPARPVATAPATPTPTPTPTPTATTAATAPARPSGVPTTVARPTAPATTTTARPPAPTRPTTGTTPAPTTTAPTTTAPTTTGSPEAEQMLALVNTERGRAGCGPVRLDARLSTAAGKHSADMAANDFFSHTGRGGSSFADRVRAEGYPSPGGENIAAGNATAGATFQQWMNSAGHRANILNCSFADMGVGVATNPGSQFRVYWTQDFGRG